MSLEELMIRRGRLLYAMDKAAGKVIAASARYDECAAELAMVDRDMRVAVEAAQSSLAKLQSPPPRPGSVTVNVPTARLGAKSEG